MLQLTPHHRILIAIDPIDFRCGIEGLSRLCVSELQDDPFNGTVFVFRNKAHTALKLLIYDGQGFWLCHKRLSRGRFHGWPRHAGDKQISLTSHELNVLLYNGSPKDARFAQDWRALPQASLHARPLP